MAEEKKEQVKLQKKDLVKHWLLGYSSEACYNYERLQALGTTNAMVTNRSVVYIRQKKNRQKH